jgi:hypothetical protein
MVTHHNGVRVYDICNRVVKVPEKTKSKHPKTLQVWLINARRYTEFIDGGGQYGAGFYEYELRDCVGSVPNRFGRWYLAHEIADEPAEEQGDAGIQSEPDSGKYLEYR